MFRSKKRKLMPLVLAVSLSGLAAIPAWGAEPIDTAADLVILRPVGVATMAIGGGVFLGTLPFTYITGTHRTAAEELVVKPYEFTIKRPLGS